MSKLIIMRGPSASGKSTYAKQMVAEDFEGTIRVNRDKLREMAHDGEFVKGITEDKILMARDALIRRYLKAGLTVIADDTNLARRNVVDLIKIANKFGAPWELKDFTNVPMDECIQRDLIRHDSVGRAVIEDQFKRYITGKPALDLSSVTVAPVEYVPYVPNREKPTAYIVDIDGTVAKMNGRSPYDYSQVSTDRPNYPVIDLIVDLHACGHEILFTSGRKSECRDDTEAWLKIFIPIPGQDWKLFMRADGDDRADYIVKMELFDRHIRNEFDVQGVFDDRDQVVEMWRKLGLLCMQVDFGDF